jgi:hypothetical protein
MEPNTGHSHINVGLDFHIVAAIGFVQKVMRECCVPAISRKDSALRN